MTPAERLLARCEDLRKWVVFAWVSAFVSFAFALYAGAAAIAADDDRARAFGDAYRQCSADRESLK